jgi:hypothetical protein
MSKVILAIGVLVIAGAAGVGAADEKKIDPTKLTCEEFVVKSEAVKPRVIAYLQGYSHAGQPVAAEVPLPAAAEVREVVAVCKEAPKQSLWDKIRAKLPGGTKKVSDPSKMTCEQFLEVEREAQPVVAAWVEGYNEGAKSPESGTKGAAAVPAALKVDVVRIVEKCRAAPADSLSDTMKKSS